MQHQRCSRRQSSVPAGSQADVDQHQLDAGASWLLLGYVKPPPQHSSSHSSRHFAYPAQQDQPQTLSRSVLCTSASAVIKHSWGETRTACQSCQPRLNDTVTCYSMKWPRTWSFVSCGDLPAITSRHQPPSQYRGRLKIPLQVWRYPRCKDTPLTNACSLHNAPEQIGIRHDCGIWSCSHACRTSCSSGLHQGQLTCSGPGWQCAGKAVPTPRSGLGFLHLAGQLDQQTTVHWLCHTTILQAPKVEPPPKQCCKVMTTNNRQSSVARKQQQCPGDNKCQLDY